MWLLWGGGNGTEQHKWLHLKSQRGISGVQKRQDLVLRELYFLTFIMAVLLFFPVTEDSYDIELLPS